MGKAFEMLKQLDKTDLKSEYLDLIEKSELVREQLNIINKEIDLVVKVGKIKGIDLLKEYSKMYEEYVKFHDLTAKELYIYLKELKWEQGRRREKNV